MMTVRAELHCSRSDFPNLTPLTAQLASPVELRATRSTRTPTKVSQLGLDRFTAAVIAASKAARSIGSRTIGSGEFDVGLNARAAKIPSQLNVDGTILEKPQSRKARHGFRGCHC